MPPEASRRAPGRLESGLLFLALASQIGLAGEALVFVGWDLAADAGPAFARFHPGTYLLLASVGLAALRYGNPLYFLDVFARERLAAACLVLSCFVVFWDIRSGFPFTGPVEAFIIPATFCLMLAEQGETLKRRLALFMHVMMAVNAVLALAQFGSLVPRLAEYDGGRSSGLLGHPLTNGAISALYILALACGGGRDLPRGTVLAALGLQLAALPTFGARTGTVIVAIGLTLVGLVMALRSLVVPPTRRALLLSLTLGPLAIATGWLLYELGAFTPLVSRFVDDAGSANARLVLPTLLHNLTAEQFWFGVVPDQIGAISMREGVEYGIESFWVGTIVLHGLWAASMLWLAFGAFSLHTISRARIAPAIVLAIAHTLIVSSANSISVKSNQLDFVAVLALCMLRRPARAYQPVFAGAPKRERRPSGAVGRLVLADPLRPSRLPPAS